MSCTFIVFTDPLLFLPDDVLLKNWLRKMHDMLCNLPDRDGNGRNNKQAADEDKLILPGETILNGADDQQRKHDDDKQHVSYDEQWSDPATPLRTKSVQFGYAHDGLKYHGLIELRLFKLGQSTTLG